jgi:hypothetical protein
MGLRKVVRPLCFRCSARVAGGLEAPQLPQAPQERTFLGHIATGKLGAAVAVGAVVVEGNAEQPGEFSVGVLACLGRKFMDLFVGLVLEEADLAAGETAPSPARADQLLD